MQAAHVSHRFIFLDALRGLAAFLIIFRHISVADTFRNQWYSSFLAVDFFFVLSGFVLQPTLPLSFESLPPYLLKRIIRLWPTYITGLILAGVGTLLLGKTHFQTELLAALPGALMLPSPLTIAPYPILGPAWSLFAEFWIANLGFALLGHKLSNLKLAALLILSGAILFAAARAHGNLDFGFTWKGVFASIPRVIFSFGLGVLIRRMQIAKKPSVGLWASIPTALVFFEVLTLPATWATLPEQFLAVGLIFPAVVYFGSWIVVNGPTKAIFEVAGTASYPLYALHVGVGGLLVFFVGHEIINLPHPTFLLGVIILMISWLFAVFIEGPIRRKLSNIFTSHTVFVTPPGPIKINASMSDISEIS